MAEAVNIAAELRDPVGKGGARGLRREGKIPAVIYGDKQDVVTIAIDGNELTRFNKLYQCILYRIPRMLTHYLSIYWGCQVGVL